MDLMGFFIFKCDFPCFSAIIRLFIILKLQERFFMSSTVQRTLSIIKPDATAKHIIGKIYSCFEAAGLFIVAAKMVHLSQQQAEAFYAIHKERPFFGDLVKFMISGPVMIQVLEGENAVSRHREIMGATNPKEAAPGTIRALYADSIEANVVHGSDSLENAAVEIPFFFKPDELYAVSR